MSGKEEEEELSMVAAEKWIMRPCCASKSTMAGDHGPATRFPSKRKAATGSSYKECEELPEACTDACATAGHEEHGPVGSGSSDVEMGKMLLPSVVAKQEADTSSMAPAAAESGAKIRLPADQLKLVLSLKRGDVSIDYLDNLAKMYTPEEIAEMGLQPEVFKVCRNEVRKKINAWTKEQWAKSKKEIRESGLVFCARDADQATQGYIEYVDSEDDDDGSECDDDSESDSDSDAED